MDTPRADDCSYPERTTRSRTSHRPRALRRAQRGDRRLRRLQARTMRLSLRDRLAYWRARWAP